MKKIKKSFDLSEKVIFIDEGITFFLLYLKHDFILSDIKKKSL